MPVVFLVRHGETDFNVAHRLQGHYQTSINARGREQARHCAGLLRDLFEREQRRPDDYAYVSSPLRRACETMELIRTALGLAPTAFALDDRLMEIAYGEWEGLNLPEIQARYPSVLAERERDKWDFAPPGGESYRRVAQRVGEWYAALVRDTVATAHGGVVRAMMANMQILPEDAATHADIRHGMVYVFDGGTVTRYA
ncbi:MAG TPA: histidine phosphatase family protein [Pseudolabrys sp.]|nr:histidine phosphatase family protein [Pseudolabrys sp.]